MARDLAQLRDGLRRWLAEGDAITGVKVLSAGHSNETYLIEGLDRILRLPPSEVGLLPPYDMPKQYRLMKAAGETPQGPPVPRMFELCEDASVLGDPFFIIVNRRAKRTPYRRPKGTPLRSSVTGMTDAAFALVAA